jgi:Flp pilus assembly protein TadD
MSHPFLNAEEYDDQAHKHYDAGDYDAALDVLRDGLRHHTDSVLLHVGLGYVRVAREEYAWARSSFGRALELDEEYEDAWVGLGETLLKFGQLEAALRCFERVDEMGLAEDLELGLTIGRALYREGLFAEARTRFGALATAHPNSAEVAAARGYTLHALGDDVGARRELRRAIRLDAGLYEARIYLAHLLHDRGDAPGALRELEQVPPAEHWDTLSLWRYIELKAAIDGVGQDDARFAAWHERLGELEADPDEIDHLLAEVEAAFEGGTDADEPAAPPSPPLDLSAQIDHILRMLAPGERRGDDGDAVAEVTHRVRTMEGAVYEGTWREIVERMRDSVSDPTETLQAFMHRAAAAVRERTGWEIPTDTPEAFVRAGARIGLLRIEQ